MRSVARASCLQPRIAPIKFQDIASLVMTQPRIQLAVDGLQWNDAVVVDGPNDAG